MAEFLDIIISFPTVVFTVMLGLLLCLSVLVLLGGAGADMLDMDLEVEVDGVEETGSSIFQFLSVVGVGAVPFSVFLTIYVFVAWAISWFSVALVETYVEVDAMVGTGVLFATLLLALPLTGGLVAPFRLLMGNKEKRKTGTGLIGEVCEVSTGSVDEDFGQARYFDGGSALVLTVRCPEENDLSRGDRALIIGYDESENNYRIEPVESLLGSNEPEPDDADKTVLEDIDFEQLEKAAEEHEKKKEQAGA